MVAQSQSAPDPDKPSDDLTPNNDIIITTDTDTDDEAEHPYNEYQPLPTQEQFDNDSNSDSEETNETLLAIIPMEESLVKEVWTEAPKSLDIAMDTDKVDQVKQAMINFTLPPTAVPEWATRIPEEQWKQELISRIQNLQQK